jgi:hypothetical protein
MRLIQLVSVLLGATCVGLVISYFSDFIFLAPEDIRRGDNRQHLTISMFERFSEPV